MGQNGHGINAGQNASTQNLWILTRFVSMRLEMMVMTMFLTNTWRGEFGRVEFENRNLQATKIYNIMQQLVTYAFCFTLLL